MNKTMGLDLQPVECQSFRRQYWPDGSNFSIKRILSNENGNEIFTRKKAKYKSEDPAMNARLLQFCEVK